MSSETKGFTPFGLDLKRSEAYLAPEYEQPPFIEHEVQTRGLFFLKQYRVLQVNFERKQVIVYDTDMLKAVQRINSRCILRADINPRDVKCVFVYKKYAEEPANAKESKAGIEKIWADDAEKAKYIVRDINRLLEV